MALYDGQYAGTTGTVVRSEEYWRWIIGRRYAHVIWVACQGEAVRGYAFIKDHKVLEIAFDPAYPQAMRALLGRVRCRGARAGLPRGHRLRAERSPGDGRDPRLVRAGSSIRRLTTARSRCTTSPTWAGSSRPSCPSCRAARSSRGSRCRWSWGCAWDDQRWLIHAAAKNSRVEPEKLSRRHLTLSPAALVRLLMGHHGVDGGVRGGGLHRLDQHGDRRRPHPVPPDAHLAQPAR